MEAILDNQVNDLIKNIDLDDTLSGKDTLEVIKNRPKLKAYLDHCSKERTYFFSLKKCGKNDCTTCISRRLLPDVFERIIHLCT